MPLREKTGAPFEGQSKILFEGHNSWFDTFLHLPFLGTKQLPFLRNKLVALLRDKAKFFLRGKIIDSIGILVAFFEKQSACVFSRDKAVVLFEEQSKHSFKGTKQLS